MLVKKPFYNEAKNVLKGEFWVALGQKILARKGSPQGMGKIRENFVILKIHFVEDPFETASFSILNVMESKLFTL